MGASLERLCPGDRASPSRKPENVPDAAGGVPLRSREGGGPGQSALTTFIQTRHGPGG